MTTSVVIAAFNGEQFIEEQLNSIINQTVLPDEIIISDDGSQDNTVAFCRDYAILHQSIPTLIKCVPNDTDEHGVVANFENAICHATGD
jgi:glycosyltransferase involved in cell wall biosynthesis